EDHHDPTAPDAFRKAQCGVQRGAARSPDEKTFVAGETPSRGLGVLRCDREDLVSEIRIPDSGHVGRGKVFDALDPVEGAVWLDADETDVRILFSEKPSGPNEGASRPQAGDQVGDRT